MTIIDSHQHFWTLSRGDYDWLTPQMKPLYQDFLPRNLAPIMEKNNVVGTMLVQAAATVKETSYLLQLASETPFVKGVIGWVDLSSEHSIADIKHLANNPYFKGIRLMHQDLDNPLWPDAATTDKLVESLMTHNLVLDFLMNEDNMQSVQSFVKRWPDLPIVIDHFAKPDLDQVDFMNWQNDIESLASFPNVLVKMSGLLELAKVLPSVSQMQPYFDHLLKVFSPNRVMWGSNWPVLTMYADYDDWLVICKDVMKAYSQSEQLAVFYQNALDLYQLESE